MSKILQYVKLADAASELCIAPSTLKNMQHLPQKYNVTGTPNGVIAFRRDEWERYKRALVQPVSGPTEKQLAAIAKAKAAREAKRTSKSEAA